MSLNIKNNKLAKIILQPFARLEQARQKEREELKSVITQIVTHQNPHINKNSVHFQTAYKKTFNQIANMCQGHKKHFLISAQALLQEELHGKTMVLTL